jgi:hypothetical protein
MKHRIARGTTKSFWQKDVVVSQESCKSVNTWAILRASARRAKKRWSDSSLLVNDLKAAGGPSCSYTITFDAIRSQTIIDSLQSMNHACSDWCPQTCGEHRLTDMDPSISVGVCVTQCSQTLLGINHDVCLLHGAATESQNQRRRTRHLFTAYVRKCSGSTPGTLERCQQ